MMLAEEIIKNYENKIHFLEKRCEQYAQAYDSLLAQIKELQRFRLRYFKELYKIEREAKDKQLAPDQRYALRQEKSKPLTENFKQWLDGISNHLAKITIG